MPATFQQDARGCSNHFLKDHGVGYGYECITCATACTDPYLKLDFGFTRRVMYIVVTVPSNMNGETYEVCGKGAHVLSGITERPI